MSRKFTKYPGNKVASTRVIKHPRKCLSTTAVNAQSQAGYDYYVTFTYGVGVFADNEDDAIAKASRSLKHDIDIDGVVNVMEYNITENSPKSVESSSTVKSDINDLVFIRKQARQAALRDGYDQVIIENNPEYSSPDGNRYSFSRKCPGCCPDWQGRVIEEVNLIWENGSPVALINEV